MPILYLINAEQLCVAYSPRPDEVMIVRYVQPLTEEQHELLEKTMKDDASFRARTRAHSLLLSSQGTTIKEIAKTYQVDRDTVSSWLKTWEHHGAQSLHDQPRSGRPPKRTPGRTGHRPTLYQRRASFSQKRGGALRQPHRETPQYFVAETASQKGSSSMETGEKVVKTTQRS